MMVGAMGSAGPPTSVKKNGMVYQLVVHLLHKNIHCLYMRNDHFIV